MEVWQLLNVVHDIVPTSRVACTRQHKNTSRTNPKDRRLPSLCLNIVLASLHWSTFSYVALARLISLVIPVMSMKPPSLMMAEHNTPATFLLKKVSIEFRIPHGIGHEYSMYQTREIARA